MSDQAEKRVRRVVGVRQVLRALGEGNAERVFLSLDAAPGIRERVLTATRAAQVPLENVAAMDELGRMCKIGVPAAACALLKSPAQHHPPENGENL